MGPVFEEVTGYLSEIYCIHHIKISAENSQANGLFEQKQLNGSEYLMKACDNQN